jgi:hypothetical protein
MELILISIATMTFQLTLCFIGFLKKTGSIQGLGDIMKATTKDKIETTKPNMNML